MAQKRVPSIDDAVKNFIDVMERSELDKFIRDGTTLLSVSPKGFTVLTTVDKPLLEKLMESDAFKEKIKAIDLTDPEEKALQAKFALSNTITEDGWVAIDLDALYRGDVIKISNDGLSYDIAINKNSLPLKLRKAEFNEISYRVFLQPNLILGIKKRFETKNVENGGFTMLRVFQII